MKIFTRLIVLCIFALILVACGDKSHEHSLSYAYNEEEHWQECNCGEVLNKENHQFDDGKITKEPTATEEGIRTFFCSCGHSYTEVIENLEPTVPIDISGIYFYPQKFAYDGKPHSVSCKGIPEGVVVEYEGNDVIEIGKYTVTAIIKDEKGRKLNELSTTLEILEEALLYTAYNQNGIEITSSNSIWNTIVNARDLGKSSNRTFVIRNSDGEKVYYYDNKVYFCYLSEEFVGIYTSELKAINWAKSYPNSYVMNGKATEFVYVGKTIESAYNLDKDEVYGTENFSGSYGYLYGKAGNDISGGAYTYCQFKVELSKAKFKYFDDECNETGWNAYVFCNMTMYNPWISCDMGIACIESGEPGGFMPIFNYHSANYNKGMYNPGPTAGIVSQMKYNEETGYWENGDDLLITCWIWENYYCMNIKNLNPNSECYNKDKTSPLYGTREWEFLCDIPEPGFNPSSSKLLLAASYCPVTNSGGFWNPRSGSAFENVIFRNMKVAQFGKHDQIQDYSYEHKDFHYILTVGADNCTITHGNDNEGAFFSISMSNYTR